MTEYRDTGAAGVIRAGLENLLHPVSPTAARRVRSAYVRRANAAFDRRYGVDTADICTRGLPTGATRYEPTDEPTFAWLMRSLDLDWRRWTFLDIGSGKGKAVMLAAHRPFRRVVGIEYVPDLDRIARRNVAALSRWQATRPPVELVQGNALRWRLPEEPLLVYLFNPFEEDFLRSVLSRVHDSLRETPRALVIATYCVDDHALFDVDWLEPLVRPRPRALGPAAAWRVRHQISRDATAPSR